jgi:hypothetical protein
MQYFLLLFAAATFSQFSQFKVHRSQFSGIRYPINESLYDQSIGQSRLICHWPGFKSVEEFWTILEGSDAARRIAATAARD